MKVDEVSLNQYTSNTQVSNKAGVPETSFSELMNKAAAQPEQQSQTENTIDLSKFDKYYNDDYYKVDSGLENNYYTEEQDYIMPVVQHLSDGSIGYLPSEDAPDEVKAAYFEGLEKLPLEERKLIGADVLLNFMGKLDKMGLDYNKPEAGQDIWNSLMGDGNVSYQGVFTDITQHYSNRIAESNDSELIAKLKMHLHAHQTVLDTLIEHGIS